MKTKNKCKCKYATSKNTKAVRDGYEMGGYLIELCDKCTQEKVERMQYFYLMKTCFGCKYEPEWDANGVGQCRWPCDELELPIGMFIDQNNIRKDNLFTGCKKWEGWEIK